MATSYPLSRSWLPESSFFQQYGQQAGQARQLASSAPRRQMSMTIGGKSYGGLSTPRFRDPLGRTVEIRELGRGDPNATYRTIPPRPTTLVPPRPTVHRPVTTPADATRREIMSLLSAPRLAPQKGEIRTFGYSRPLVRVVGGGRGQKYRNIKDIESNPDQGFEYPGDALRDAMGQSEQNYVSRGLSGTSVPRITRQKMINEYLRNLDLRRQALRRQ